MARPALSERRESNGPALSERRESNGFDWRRPLIYTHRWLGITGCLLCLMWFLSGLVMMYARMPGLTTEERLMRLPALDLATARVGPADLAAGLQPIERVRIGMLADRPVYRLHDGRQWHTVFADSAAPLDALAAEEALALARAFMPEHASTIVYDARLTDADQWTLESRSLMPMHRIGVGDASGTDLYVSDRTGEVVLKTDAGQRRLAYLGAVPHWIYFTPFRRRTTLWAQSIIWISIAGCVLSLTGLVWGLWRYSRSRRYRLKDAYSHTPYAGLMRWHHYAGLIFGVTTFTWLLSGLLSMDPWSWHPDTAPTPQQRDAVSGGPLRLNLLTLDRLQRGITALGSSGALKELEIVQFQGEPFLVAHRFQAAPAPDGTARPTLSESRLVSLIRPERGVFPRFEERAALAAARAAMPGVVVEDTDWLRQYDAYYYDRYGARALPVLRVRFRDAQRTWLYLDPQQGAIAQKEERLTRVNRWLYHGLHSFDFPFLYDRRPLWDIVVIVLSLGGIVLSATTIGATWRRLRRHARAFAGGAARAARERA